MLSLLVASGVMLTVLADILLKKSAGQNIRFLILGIVLYALVALPVTLAFRMTEFGLLFIIWEAATVAQQLNVPTQNVLGLSGIESTWGTSNAATQANNFFGLHGGANAPFATGVWYTSGGVAMSSFPSYLASAQSFAAQYGRGCLEEKISMTSRGKCAIHFSTGSGTQPRSRLTRAKPRENRTVVTCKFGVRK